MNSYFVSLVAISAITGICSYISYGEKSDPVQKCALVLILIYVISVPAVGLVREIGEMDFYEGIFERPEISLEDTDFSESAQSAFENGIRNFISESFSVPKEDVRVIAFGFDAREMKAQKIKVILSSSAALADNRQIAQSVSESGLGECEVEIDFG